jgi:hypothetical protein
MDEQLTLEQAAERERHDLLACEAKHHAENIAVEMRRYAAATEHAERVYRLRLGLPDAEGLT